MHDEMIKFNMIRWLERVMRRNQFIEDHHKPQVFQNNNMTKIMSICALNPKKT
jgi:hypothetical protein